jgi:hypothetical protein
VRGAKISKCAKILIFSEILDFSRFFSKFLIFACTGENPILVRLAEMLTPVNFPKYSKFPDFGKNSGFQRPPVKPEFCSTRKNPKKMQFFQIFDFRDFSRFLAKIQFFGRRVQIRILCAPQQCQQMQVFQNFRFS